MILREILDQGKNRLHEAGIAESDLDAWLLLEYVTGISRAMYYVRQNEEVSQEKAEHYYELVGKRSRRVPLQHITGEQEFMGLTFKVNEFVLVPRQDTEILVEEALKVMHPGMRILDMCTGSGCILISLMQFLKDRGIAAGDCVGADVSPEALAIAKENADRYGLTPSFIQGDIFERITGTYDIIVSNPPYIRTDEIEKLEPEVKEHDPVLALDGKEDGFYFYNKIIEDAPKYLEENGWLYFEIGFDQAEEVKKRMEESGFTQVTVKKDLTGLDRVVYGVYNRAEKTGRN